MTYFGKLFNKIEKAVIETAHSNSISRQLGCFIDDVRPVIANNKALSQKYEEIKLAQLKLHYLQAQLHPEQVNQLNPAQARELQIFIEGAEALRQQLNFDAWRLQQEKALQLELLQRNQNLQRELITYQRQTSLKVVEEQKRLQNSPVWLVASDILNSHPDNAIMPLRVFLAPPRLQFERFASAASVVKGFPDIELSLAEELRQFFKKYSTADRPIDFLAGAWVSKSFHSEASIKALFGVLKSEPTLVLESEVDGDYLNFRMAYWGVNCSKYRYEPVISRLPYQEILYNSAKARAEKWLETKEKLIAAGENPAEIDALYGGDNLVNLETWQREQRFKKAGVDTNEIEFHYTINKQDVEKLCQFLAIYHCLFAGLVIDEYFLVQYNFSPWLPLLLPLITANMPDSEVERITQAIIYSYQNLCRLLENQRFSLIPELALNFAQNLLNFPNKDWAKQEICYSIRSWLKLRGLTSPDDFHSLLETLSLALAKEDDEYIQLLNQCLVAVDTQIRLNIEEACYKRGMSCYQAEHYEAAIVEFDQVIQLKPNWAEAYYSRGLAHAHLEQYPEAIADYTQAIQLQKKWKEAYNSRGNAYLKLGDYPKAIADYSWAISIDPDFEVAISKRALAQQVYQKLKRQRRQETECQQWASHLAVTDVLIGHTHSVCCLAISPDGMILASGSDDCTIKLWELHTGREIRTLRHGGGVEAIAISPDGTLLASGSDDTTIRLWELSTGRELCNLKHFHKVCALAFSPDGQTLASGLDDGTIKLWDLKSEPRIIKGHAGAVRCLAFSPNGEILASGSTDSTLKLWHVSQGKRVLTLGDHLLAVNSIVFSPDGQTLFRGSYDDQIKQWQLNKQQESLLKGHRNGIYSLAISPDGQTLVSSSADLTMKIWQVTTGQEIRTVAEDSQTILAVLFSPDGQTLVTSSAAHTIKIWRSL